MGSKAAAALVRNALEASRNNSLFLTILGLLSIFNVESLFSLVVATLSSVILLFLRLRILGLFLLILLLLVLTVCPFCNQNRLGGYMDEDIKHFDLVEGSDALIIEDDSLIVWFIRRGSYQKIFCFDEKEKITLLGGWGSGKMLFVHSRKTRTMCTMDFTSMSSVPCTFPM